jgi:hypothetical protein
MPERDCSVSTAAGPRAFAAGHEADAPDVARHYPDRIVERLENAAACNRDLLLARPRRSRFAAHELREIEEIVQDRSVEFSGGVE